MKRRKQYRGYLIKWGDQRDLHGERFTRNTKWMLPRRRTYRNINDSLDLLAAPLLWLAGLLGRVWDRVRRRK